MWILMLEVTHTDWYIGLAAIPESSSGFWLQYRRTNNAGPPVIDVTISRKNVEAVCPDAKL